MPVGLQAFEDVSALLGVFVVGQQTLILERLELP
jgi:hypothetical protein